MGAPKGNQFWKARSKHGKDKIFKEPESLWEAACEYFEWADTHPLWESKALVVQGEPYDHAIPKMRAMTLDGLWLFLGIGRQTWYEYKARNDYSEVIERIEHVIRDQKFAGASAGLLNANIIARDLGLADTSKQELTGANGGAIKTESKVTWTVQPVKPIEQDPES